MSKRLPTEQEFLDWLDHPVTQAQNQLLETWREELRDRLEDGIAICPTTDYNPIQAALFAGHLSVIKQLMNMDYQGLTSGVER